MLGAQRTLKHPEWGREETRSQTRFKTRDIVLLGLILDIVINNCIPEILSKIMKLMKFLFLEMPIPVLFTSSPAWSPGNPHRSVTVV